FPWYPPPSHIESPILSLDVVLPLPDGRILVAGAFGGANVGYWQYARGIARLNSDGSVDLDYLPGSFRGINYAYFPIFAGAALQPEGEVILAGQFWLQTNP